MSADNGIYILQTKDENGVLEYRVAHLGAIENLYYSDPSGDEVYMWLFFRKSPLFYDKNDAYEWAKEIEKEILDDDFGIIEYGIVLLEVNKSFPKTRPFNIKSYFNDYEE